MEEIWENTFQEKQEMWGFEPAQSARQVVAVFLESNIRNILIPGIGYGRNAQVFTEKGISVTGIEISPTAIAMAKKHFGNQFRIHEGSVLDMPFDSNHYEGIFCYALIHLLNYDQRLQFIKSCYNQLQENGIMFFIAVTKKAPMYGKGNYISPDYYEVFDRITMFFYDEESITQEFKAFGLQEISEIQENLPFYLIKCQKKIL